ncbi:hypothetical protein KBY97_13910 [Synechococcus sp. ATX 2A4]|uniref:hypothetical protein n=1 Tax=Synechococcus sp. ATX 2A4 TaxID=2823727 RepID=UPI0020CE52DB|nr:hypothetical protein [Synechococcus sp. ATX 2A4]MCP9886210.1 hypothetical protein [Synechococcus sp. ATX 2A4]
MTARLKSPILCLLGALAACSLQAPQSFQTIDGSTADRVAAISKLLSRTAPLPSSLLDAHFFEQQTGDGRLGPSDFEAFYALTVAPAHLPAWRAALSPLKPWNHFSNDDDIKRAAPSPSQPWWLSEDDLSFLEFYSPQSLTGRANGWVGLAPDGRIFVYAFTL